MLKRLFDILISVPGILVLSPFFLVIAGLIAVKLGRPVFFNQERPGLRGKPFNMIKFRTMTNETDEEGKLLPNKKRLPKAMPG